MQIFRLSGFAALVALAGCTATMPSGEEIQAANTFLAQQAWGGDPGRRSAATRTGAAGKRAIVRNETYEAIAGSPMQVGIRWAINKDCTTKPFSVRIVQQPRFGRAYVRPTNYLVPASSIDGRGEQTLRRCAGLPTVGQAIFYEPPAGRGNYYDNFAVETTTGLRFNYRILVTKPVG